jgi:hypothetical protein
MKNRHFTVYAEKYENSTHDNPQRKQNLQNERAGVQKESGLGSAAEPALGSGARAARFGSTRRSGLHEPLFIQKHHTGALSALP